ncbi:hypothetical protein CAPN001_17210 [Capnocytophaga stomatis]|uniref:Membrane-binding protein n=1 Tax=Capnocytophaga stomatis TaxID=1848904 RepID=A0A250G2G4_9FLAO|nr:membrane-binding protein [Capnocytophaga stomatis]ATA90426.1 membrane-binding protein [Capnocytophaga stomatis]GIJ97152.1 hypothetical protein CAPN001_17210 [Capnocytophaga stomatis]
MAKSFAEKLVQLQLLIDGLKQFKDNLPAGVTEESIVKLEKFKAELESLNSQKESAKAEAKQLTNLINKKTKEMEVSYNDIRKRVKIDIDIVVWKKFGINDKK